MNPDADPVVIRRCDRCGENRILLKNDPDARDMARCGCGTNELDRDDLAALADRGP